MAKMVLGHSLGIDPATAMQNILIVNGKMSFSGNLTAARIKQSGKYRYEVVQKTAEVCELQFYEKVEDWTEDGRQIFRWIKPGPPESFSVIMAKRAGLFQQNPKTWGSYPEAMLFNRCLTAGARTYCPDIFAGNPCYSPEELDPSANVTVTAEGEVVVDVETAQPEPPPPPKKTKIQKPEVVTDAEIVSESKPGANTVNFEPLYQLIDSLQYDPAPLLKYHGKKRLEDLTQDEVNYSVGILEQKKRAPK